MKALVCSIISAFLACPVVLAHGGGGGGHMGGGGGHSSFHSSFSGHSSFSHSSFGGSHYSGFNSSFGHSSFGHSLYEPTGHADVGEVPSTFSSHSMSHSIGTTEAIRATEAGTALHAGFLSPAINPTHLDRVPLNVNAHHGLMSGFGHGFSKFFGFGHSQLQTPTAVMPASMAQFGHPSFISNYPLSSTLAVAMLCSPAFLHSNWMVSPYEYSRTNSTMLWNYNNGLNNYNGYNNYNNYNNWNNWYSNPLPVTSFYSPYFAYPGLNDLDATLAQAYMYPTFEPFPYFGQYFDRLDPAPWFLPGPNAISENYPVPLGTPFPVSKLDEPQTSTQPTVLGDNRVIDPELVPFDMSYPSR
jgi:hypothetical protein